MKIRLLTAIIGLTALMQTVCAEDAPWSGTLPVMHIATEGDAPVTSKDTYIKASYWLDPMGAEGVEAVGTPEDPEGMQIRGRGNYTWWGFEKKPYRLKLDRKTPLLGMDASRHFALMAHADDPAAGLRTVLGFEASEIVEMPWTPATRPLEVVLNGDYIGLYWLTETVRVAKDRVDVIEQEDRATEDVDGGWLVEIDNYDAEPHVTVIGSSGDEIWITYKSPEILSFQQEAYLHDAMESIQDALAASNETATSHLVDFDVLARYFIVNQLMLDMESFHGSCYINRQRGEGEKWKFGPVWDFGNSFAHDRGEHPRFIFDRPEYSQHWIGEFYALPSFQSEVKEEWKAFLDGGGPGRLEASLFRSAGEIAAAALCDARRWPAYAHADVGGQASLLREWLDNSVEWLKEQWGSGSSVEGLPESRMDIRVEGNVLVVDSGCEGSVAVFSLDGHRHVFDIKPGRNGFSLPRGFYILKDRKILVK